MPAISKDIRIIDGDSSEMDGEIIRLWGIDAPEIGQYCQVFHEPAEVGTLAADVLENLTRQLSYCEPTGDRS